MVGVGIGGGEIFAVAGDHEHLVVALEHTEASASAVVVEADHVGVEPDLASSEGACSLAFHRYALDLVFGHEVAERILPLDGERGEVDGDFSVARSAPGAVRFVDECHPDGLRLAVGVGGEPFDAAPFRLLGEVVILVAGEACDMAALHVGVAAEAVAVDDVVGGAFVAFLIDADVDHLLADI